MNKAVSSDTIKKIKQKQRLSWEDCLESYELIEPFLCELKSQNQRTIYSVERLSDGALKRVGVILHYVQDFIPFLYPVLGIDAGAMKIPKIYSKKIAMTDKQYCTEDMVVTVLAGRIPGNQILILGFVLGYTECSDDIIFLFELARANGISFDRHGWTILSDRGSALIKAHSHIFTNSLQQFCAKHLSRNLIARGWKRHLNLFWSARNAVTLNAHCDAMNKIRAINNPMYEYLNGIENWQVYKVVEKGNMLFNMKSDNIVEGIMSWILECRYLSPLYFIKAIMLQIYEHIEKQRQAVIGETNVLLKFAKNEFELLMIEIRDSPRSVVCLDASNGVYVVHKILLAPFELQNSTSM